MIDETTDKLRTKNPCRLCGSKLIEFHKTIVQMHDYGMDEMEVYCYCCNCKNKSALYIAKFKDLDEARDMAYTIWNNENKLS